MENARQPASHAFGARHVSDIDRWVADVPTISVDVDEIHPAHDFDSGASTLSIRPSASSRRNFQAKPYPRCVIGFFACDIADRPDHYVPGVSGVADGGCDSAHPGPTVGHAQELASVGDRGPSQACGRPEPAGDL